MKQLFRLFFYLLSKFSRRRMIPENPGKILVVMCHWLGDTFWAMQVLPALMKRLPDAEIFVGCKSFSIPLFDGVVERSNIITLDSVVSDRKRERTSKVERRGDIDKVAEKGFDLAIDLTSNRYSAWFLHRVGIPSVGLDIHELSPLYSSRGSGFDDSKHLRFRPWATMEVLFPVEKIPPPAYLTRGKNFLQVAEALEIEKEDRLAMLVPGAGWPEKIWPAENFMECGRCLEDMGLKVLISGSRTERAFCGKVASALKAPTLLIDDLESLLAIIPKLDCAICNDSGPAHLIAATGVPVVAIFLDTSPERCGPVGSRVEILTADNASSENVILYAKRQLRRDAVLQQKQFRSISKSER